MTHGKTWALQQVRIRESARINKGRFGIEYKQRVRVLEPGTFEVWEAGDDSANAGYTQIEAGTMSVRTSRFARSMGKRWVLGRPPLLPIAALNISHYQKASDLTQSLHIAAQPILMVPAWMI